MVATVHVFFDFAGSDNTPGTQQDTNGLGPPNLRFKTADDATIDAINPIPIPTQIQERVGANHGTRRSRKAPI